jgi:hypothetical protein
LQQIRKNIRSLSTRSTSLPLVCVEYLPVNAANQCVIWYCICLQNSLHYFYSVTR